MIISKPHPLARRTQTNKQTNKQTKLNNWKTNLNRNQIDSHIKLSVDYIDCCNDCYIDPLHLARLWECSQSGGQKINFRFCKKIL